MVSKNGHSSKSREIDVDTGYHFPMQAACLDRILFAGTTWHPSTRFTCLGSSGAILAGLERQIGSKSGLACGEEKAICRSPHFPASRVPS